MAGEIGRSRRREGTRQIWQRSGWQGWSDGSHARYHSSSIDADCGSGTVNDSSLEIEPREKAAETTQDQIADKEGQEEEDDVVAEGAAIGKDWVHLEVAIRGGASSSGDEGFWYGILSRRCFYSAQAGSSVAPAAAEGDREEIAVLTQESCCGGGFDDCGTGLNLFCAGAML